MALGRDVIDELRALARFLIGRTQQPHNLSDATIEALHTDAGRSRLAEEFEKVDVERLRLHWVDGPELAGDITPKTLGLRVVSIGGRRGTRLFRINGSCCQQWNPELDPQAVAHKRQLIIATSISDAAMEMAGRQSNEAALATVKALIQEYMLLLTQDAERLAVEQLLATPDFGWQHALACYYAVGADPAKAVMAAFAETHATDG